jgi:antitoxin HicB
MKDLKYYLSLNYRKTVYQDEDGDYIVEVTELPGCLADGATPDEAFANLREAMVSWLKSRMEAGLEIPEPRELDEYSGKVLLRMPKFLHRRLSEQAVDEGVSLNHYLVALLSASSTDLGIRAPSVFTTNVNLNAAIAARVSEIAMQRLTETGYVRLATEAFQTGQVAYHFRCQRLLGETSSSAQIAPDVALQRYGPAKNLA